VWLNREVFKLINENQLLDVRIDVQKQSESVCARYLIFNDECTLTDEERSSKLLPLVVQTTE
jgi:phenylalanyl-tRNA synthetase beta subunit